MKDKIIERVNPAIIELNMFVSDVYLTDEENINTLNIELDSNEVIDVDRVVLATNIINPIIDELDLIDGEYVLDIHSREKGDGKDE